MVSLQLLSNKTEQPTNVFCRFRLQNMKDANQRAAVGKGTAEATGLAIPGGCWGRCRLARPFKPIVDRGEIYGQEQGRYHVFVHTGVTSFECNYINISKIKVIPLINEARL
jgi:hypothetical protein